MKRSLRIFAFLVLAALLLGCNGCSPPPPPRVILDYKRDLAVLTTRSNLSGLFFLASGVINTEPMYVFIEVDSKGLSVVKSVPIIEGAYQEDIVIEKPYVERFRCVEAVNSPINCAKNIEGVPEAFEPRPWPPMCNFYIFHIPKGSVASTYDLGFTPQHSQ